MTMNTASIVVDDEITFIAGNGGGLWGVSANVTPWEAFTDLATMLSRMSRAFCRDSATWEITVLLGRSVIRRLGFPDDAPAEKADAIAHPLLTPVRENGWTVNRLGPWMTAHRPNGAAVHVGVLPWLDSDTFELMSPEAATTAYRVQWFSKRFGVGYRARPGVTSIAAMRKLVGGRAPFWKPNWSAVAPVGPFESQTAWERPYIWDSPDTDTLALDHKWLHGWDVKGQFLAAAAAAYLPRDMLRHTNKREYDKTAGYWKIATPAWAFERALPNPTGNGLSHGDITWVTSPTMELLRTLSDEYGVLAMPEILDSWTADKPTRLLRNWAERTRDMLMAARHEPDADDAVVLYKAVKHSYTHGIAMLRSPESTIYRTDWNDTINGTAQKAFWLKLWKQFVADRRAPVKIYCDMAYYASSEIDPEKDRPSTFEPSLSMGRLRYGKSVEL